MKPLLSTLKAGAAAAVAGTREGLVSSSLVIVFCLFVCFSGKCSRKQLEMLRTTVVVLRTDIQTEMETQITLNLVVSPMLVDTLLSWLGSVAYSGWRKKQEVKKQLKKKQRYDIV